MLRLNTLLAYRITWLIGSYISLFSLVMAYAYGNTLTHIMQTYLPKTFDAIKRPDTQNFMVSFSSIGFILILTGATLGIIYSIVASSNSRIWNAPSALKIWNTAVLGLVGIVTLSAPVLVYSGKNLVQVLSLMGTQYSPTFEGFDTGYYLTWIGVLVSLIAARGVLKNEPSVHDKGLGFS
jgi:hypothetical protein